jgi:signal transduction histidine kinase
MRNGNEHDGVTASSPPRRLSWRGWFDPGEPHLARGPFARWPLATDVTLALVVFAASVIAVSVSALPDGQDFTFARIRELPAGAIVLLGLAAVGLVGRRHRPITVLILVLVAMVVWSISEYGDGQELALVVATYSVGRYASDQRHSLAALVAVIVISIGGTAIDSQQRVDIAPALILSALPWYVGRRVRNRGEFVALLQDRAARLEAEQQARARQAVAEERARIARELHDVVAHRVSMMTIQAGAAKTIAHDDLDAAVGAMADVEHAGRQALGELRHLLGVLRPDNADPDQLGPQPGISEIQHLVNDLEHAATRVDFTLDVTPTDVAAAIDLSAYRIVQESLTNIVKHAGPNPKVDLLVELDHGELVIDIVNTTQAAPSALPSSGFGLPGMRERVSLLGGTMTAGPDGQNRYRVHARIPVETELA